MELLQILRINDNVPSYRHCSKSETEFLTITMVHKNPEVYSLMRMGPLINFCCGGYRGELEACGLERMGSGDIRSGRLREFGGVYNLGM